MRHGEQFPLTTDEHVAVAVGQWCVKQRDVGHDGWQQDDRVAGSERVVDHLPVGAGGEQIGPEQPAQRNERDALLPRLERGMDGRTGGVQDLQRAGLQRGGKARAGTELAESNSRGLDGLHATGTNQQVGLQSADGHADQVQAAHAPAHQRPGRGHRHASRVLRNGELGAIRDSRHQRVDADYHGPLRAGTVKNGVGRRILFSMLSSRAMAFSMNLPGFTL